MRRAARLTVVVLVLAVATPAHAVVTWTAVDTPDPGGTVQAHHLYAVHATSATRAWAVGSYKDENGNNLTLTERWNGSTWKVIESPNPGGPADSGHDDNYLFGVAGVSASDAWAVGSFNTGEGYRTMILHWDGEAWARVPSPSPTGYQDELRAVTARSATDVWAVGSTHDGVATSTLILHWNGLRWKRVVSPNPASNEVHLEAVSASGASNAWATGWFNDGVGYTTLILRWNGTAWKRQPSPSPDEGGENRLHGVTAISGDDAWAVGYTTGGSAYQTVTLHWNGTSWARVASPNPGGGEHADQLLAVARQPGTNKAWATGWFTNGTATRTLVMRWNGTSWVVQPSDDPAGEALGHVLYGVTSTSGTDAWAVGEHESDDELQTLALHCCA
jgi:hypothetical protein